MHNEYGVLVRAYGGAEMLAVTPMAAPVPQPGELLVRHEAIGVNFIDIYCRAGVYAMITPPGAPGFEAAGVVEAIGDGVTNFSVGNRVAYIAATPGSYTTCRSVPAHDCLLLPDDISSEEAAAGLLKGLTAELLLHRCHPLRVGATVLVHAATGGVGSILCRWAARLGYRVIGAVGSDSKRAAALALGCDAVVITAAGVDWVGEVMSLTNGVGVDVVYDSVGKDTLEKSFQALRTFGHVVNFGQSSGMLPQLEIKWLAAKSAGCTRPSIFHYKADRVIYESMANRFFAALRSGDVSATVAHRYALKDAADAHRLLETRASSGSIVLVP